MQNYEMSNPKETRTTKPVYTTRMRMLAHILASQVHEAVQARMNSTISNSTRPKSRKDHDE